MLRRLVLVTASLFLATAAGCKQGEGDRCQVSNDCADGLVCSASTPSTCVTPGSGGNDDDGGMPDAEEPPDARPVDAPPPQCSDGIDNEAKPDLRIDFPDDLECISADDDDESA